jgi:quinoprotein glucose dehydrogenase
LNLKPCRSLFLLLFAGWMLATINAEAIDYDGPTAGWPFWGGDTGGTRFSPLTQITPQNVDQLKVAWVYHTHDFPAERKDATQTTFEANPIIDNDTLYFCSGLSRAFAIDATTGKEKWVYDSKPNLERVWSSTCRGVAIWKSEKDEGACSKRIFMGTVDGRMVGLDATTGKPCEDFGNHGVINLNDGIGDVEPGEMHMTSPPTVINDVVVQGALVWDNHRVDSPGGVIRAWDVHTGKVRWAFDPVPPGSPPPQTFGAPPEQKYYRGTPNAWGIFSTDPQRNLIFIPFGGAGPDFVGGLRRRFGFDLDYYANALVALDATTGKVAWFFSAVHHDLWDYDLAAQPVLIDVEKDGGNIPAIALATKMGMLFILNRDTGKPVYPVEERPVPQTDVSGEYTSPTQPFPTFPKPLHPLGLTVDDAWGFTFYDRNACRKKIEASANRGMYTPPSLKHNIEYPGVAGGQDWGGLAYDAKNKLLVMPQSKVIAWNQLIPREQHPDTNAGKESLYMGYSPNTGTPYIVKHEILLSPFGVPCIAPPWGTIFAVSLDSGEKIWEKPFGTTRDMVPGLSALPLGLNFGLPSAGGPIITASGLVFIGAAMDNYIRAYDIHTGQELWRARLPAGGQATPITYRLHKDGKQFVVIAAGGHASMGTTPGDSLMAFVLPDN